MLKKTSGYSFMRVSVRILCVLFNIGLGLIKSVGTVWPWRRSALY